MAVICGEANSVIEFLGSLIRAISSACLCLRRQTIIMDGERLTVINVALLAGSLVTFNL